MIDDLEGRLATVLRERFPMPTDVDLRSRLDRPASKSRVRLRVVVAVAACVAAVVAVSILLALRTSNTSQKSAAGAQLIGVTWHGAGTVVFTDHTVRIFDGCTNQLLHVTIGTGILDIGSQIGPSSICTGTPSGPPPAVAAFDAVLFSRHLTWQRTGDTLRLINDAGQSVELQENGRALSVIGQEWALERYDDSRSYTHEGDYTAARLFITAEGSVHASDLCNDLAGTATVTDAAIAFVDMRSTAHRCKVDPVAAAASTVIDQVLSGDTTYAIRGDELIINGKGRGNLLYTPSP